MPSAPSTPSRRGRWLLLGLDVAVDEALVPTVLEANLNPELTLDGPRTRLNRRLAKRAFDLLLEAHAKARPLFPRGQSGGGRLGDAGCAAEAFRPAAVGSALARNLTRTAVPGWTLLYSDAVAPPYVHGSSSTSSSSSRATREAEPGRTRSQCYAEPSPRAENYRKR